MDYKKLNKEDFLKDKNGEHYPISVSEALMSAHGEIMDTIGSYGEEIFWTVVNMLKSN